jgi:transposase
MLNIYYNVCCGIDVHKKMLVATIAKTDEHKVTTYDTKQFSTFTKDILKLKQWLIDNNCKDVCMESTGKYWIPIFNILEDTCKVIITHPKYVRAIPGKKTDTKDSVWISDIFKHGLVNSSFMPPSDIRQLRDLMRYRFKLLNCRTSEKNRFQNSLTMSNIQISNVLSDTFGKTAQSILSLMLSKNDTITLDEITPLLRTNLKASPQDILDSVQGNLSNEQNSKMKICLTHYDNITQCVEEVENAILPLTSNYQNEIKIILTAPGIKDISAIYILSEIGADMSVFKSDNHLCSWAGLTPQSNESAGKKKSVKISRAGVYIKPLLVQCANNAIRDKSCPYFKLRYEAIKKRRGHKRAIIAIARMLLTCIYHMLLKNEPFNNELYKQYTNSNFKSKNSKLNINNAIEFLEKQGFTIKQA